MADDLSGRRRDANLAHAAAAIRRRFVVTGIVIVGGAALIHSLEHRLPGGRSELLATALFTLLTGACLFTLKRLVVLRALAETAARNAELDAVLYAIPDTILVNDRSGRIREVFTRLGDPTSEVVGLTAEDFMTPQSANRARAAIMQALEQGGVTSTEVSTDENDTCVYEIRATRLDDDHCVTLVRDITERKAAEALLETMATHDPLTGLLNRRRITDHIDRTIERARRTAAMTAVLFCDLDRFKVVNDSLGHASGDALLLAVAARMESVLRPTDTVGRFGGDEFVVVVDDLHSVTDATNLALRLIAVLEEPFVVGGREVFVGASIGIAFWNGCEATAEELLRNADAAMYRAKDAGRGQYAIFDEAMASWANARLDFEAALRQAIERDELRLHYQPIVDLVTGRTVKFEALLRWERPGLGLVSPAEFIEVAEETGLIVPIGHWVVAEACRAAAEWQSHAPGVGVTVNVSPRQMLEGSIVDTVRLALDESWLPASLLTIEVTEGVLVQDPGLVVEILHLLRDLGVSIALDDFGTGYSSLTYLRRLPIDVLKIDQSFVRGLGTDEHSESIVAVVIDLAHRLGMDIVAEGVSDPAHLATLRALACPHGQGYLFARPMSERDVYEYLVERSDAGAHSDAA